jgi:hypothetical protein
MGAECKTVGNGKIEKEQWKSTFFHKWIMRQTMATKEVIKRDKRQ